LVAEARASAGRIESYGASPRRTASGDHKYRRNAVNARPTATHAPGLAKAHAASRSASTGWPDAGTPGLLGTLNIRDCEGGRRVRGSSHGVYDPLLHVGRGCASRRGGLADLAQLDWHPTGPSRLTCPSLVQVLERERGRIFIAEPTRQPGRFRVTRHCDRCRCGARASSRECTFLRRLLRIRAPQQGSAHGPSSIGRNRAPLHGRS